MSQWGSQARRQSLAWLAATVVAAVLPAQAAPSAPVKGEVRRVDPDAGRVTLKHGPIPELELPAMTLVYRVQDPAILVQVRPGDTITFIADRVDGHYVVISIRR